MKGVWTWPAGGLACGRAYAKTRNLMAPALLSTLVDVAWRAFCKIRNRA